jgi:hypothetical protein
MTDVKTNLPDAIDLIVEPRARDLGDFEVRRVLPSVRRRMVGSFVFLDQMGPTVITAGHGIDVRPHPHIGLATVTYLYQGSLLHRDSLGVVQPISPGDVNWMTAGSGIVHSERSGEEIRKLDEAMFGLQLWVALPKDKEEMAPEFKHYGRAELPELSGEGIDARIVAGTLFDKTSPVKTETNLFFVDVALAANARLAFGPEHEERAAYVLGGEIAVEGARFAPSQMLVFQPGRQVVIEATADAKFVLLGGEPMDGPREIYWNFVSSRKERIAQAKEDWRNGKFATIPGDDVEFIPLPDD